MNEEPLLNWKKTKYGWQTHWPDNDWIAQVRYEPHKGWWWDVVDSTSTVHTCEGYYEKDIQAQLACEEWLYPIDSDLSLVWNGENKAFDPDSGLLALVARAGGNQWEFFILEDWEGEPLAHPINRYDTQKDAMQAAEQWLGLAGSQ